MTMMKYVPLSTLLVFYKSAMLTLLDLAIKLCIFSFFLLYCTTQLTQVSPGSHLASNQQKMSEGCTQFSHQGGMRKEKTKCEETLGSERLCWTASYL